MKQDYKYMVCVRCLTYNHSTYIEETLNGFAIQETTFPFVCCIVDDASTDGEQDIIRSYIDNNLDCQRIEETDDYQMIIANHRNNRYCSFVVLLLKYNHYGKKTKSPYIKEWTENAKYYAMCEGDDYWTSPNKLQKQVTFLETHPEYSICVHDFKKYIQNENRFLDKKQYSENFSFDYGRYIKELSTQLLTAVARTSSVPTREIMRKYRYFRDNHMYYYILRHGKGYFMAEVMGVYRITNKGIWTSLNILEKTMVDLKCYAELYEHHPEENEFRKLCIDLYSSYMFLCHINHQKIENIQCKSLGIMGMIEVYLRYYAIKLHSIIKPELKSRSLVNKE